MADAAVADVVGRLGTRHIALKGGLPAHLLRRIDVWIRPVMLEEVKARSDTLPRNLYWNKLETGAK